MTSGNSDHYFSLPPGTRLLNFEIRSTLGHGGFGITYQAFDVDLHEMVALKEYLPNEMAVRTGDQSVRAKSESTAASFREGVTAFLEEARILARFRHPNIIRVRRFFELNGTGYIVADYVEGSSLGEVLRQKTLSQPELSRLLNGALDGLEVLHDAAVLHRDLKPSNIMVQTDGTPILIDFGAARNFADRNTRTVTAIATSGYSPPEQYGVGGQQGPWTDIYALGAIAYRCVTGQVPPDSLRRLRNDPIKSAEQFEGAQIDRRLLKAIDKMMMVNEEDRPSSVAEVRKLIDLPSTSSDSIASPPQMRTPGRRLRTISVAIAAVCAIAVTAVAIILYNNGREQLRETEARQVLDQARFDVVRLQALIDGCAVNGCPVDIKSDASRRIMVVQQEDRLFRAAEGNIRSLQAYLQNCEACSHRSTAEQEIGKLEQAARDAQQTRDAAERERQAEQVRRQQDLAKAETSLFNNAESLKSRELYAQYLSIYPTGMFAERARTAIGQIDEEVRIYAQSPQITDAARLASIRDRLFELNYDPGTNDRVALEKAVAAFEADSRLPTRGQATEALLERLQRAEPPQVWGAIVYSREDRKWGAASKATSRKQAVQAARTACAPAQCSVELSFFGGGCGAIGYGDRVWALASRRTKEAAQQAVRAECRQKGKECTIQTSFCAPDVIN